MRVTSCVVAARVWCLPGIVGAAVEEVDSSDPYTIPQHLPPFNSAQGLKQLVDDF
jgi:hypothetical protein